MGEPIFTQQETSVDVSNDSMLNFKDCPNRCIDGYYIDPYKHKRLKCQFCADKRKKAVREGLTIKGTGVDVASLLNFPRAFIGYSDLSLESVIPEGSRKLMVQESVDSVLSELKGLLQSVSNGDVSPCSLLLNLGSRAYDENFVFSYLFRAYEAGLTVAPYTSAYDLHLTRLDSENGDAEARKKFDKLLTSEVCIIVIDAGATRTSIKGVKGLMQMRAYRGFSTIVTTHTWGKDIMFMQADDTSADSKSLARLISIEYTDKFLESEARYQDTKQPVSQVNNRAGVSTEDFNNLLRGRQNI